MNGRVVFRAVGRVLLLEAALLLLPLFTALLYRESPIPFLAAIGAAAVPGLALTLCFHKPQGEVYAREGFAIVSLSWIAVSLAGCVPFLVGGATRCFADALFETISGFSTTGATVFSDTEGLGRGLLFWRALTHWIGGMGILVFIMALSDRTPDRAINVLRAEMPGQTVDKLLPRARSTARILYYLYLGLTVCELLALLCGGLSFYESAVYALSTAGTGGFGLVNDSLASATPYVQWVVTVFMLLFGVNFNLYYLMLLRRWRAVGSNDELWCYLGILAAASLVIAVDLRTVYTGAGECLRQACFQTVSFVTTTGFLSADYSAWPALSRSILFLLLFCGGCVGSTAGGLKVSRILVLFRHARCELQKTLRTRRVRSVRLNGAPLEVGYISGITAYFALYLLVAVVVFLLISWENFSLETNLSAAVTCLNNVGPAFGSAASGFGEYSAFSKLVLSAAMLMGRLEIYPILILFMPRRGR